LELKCFRLDFNLELKKWMYKNKIASQPITAMAGAKQISLGIDRGDMTKVEW
jgi:hypothetical protein